MVCVVNAVVFCYISLDIFRKNLHNKGIKNDLDAWLTFLCEDEPEMIESLLRQYPYFQFLYNDLYRLCENLEDVMGYYSEALQKMDRDTVQYMIEEQEKEIEELKKDKEELKRRVAELERQLEVKS